MTTLDRYYLSIDQGRTGSLGSKHRGGENSEAGHVYFGVFGRMLRTDVDDIRFGGRSRRPPLDPVNAVLSFLSTLLVHDCRSALETAGLDPSVGFLHRLRPGRPSLALDLSRARAGARIETLLIDLLPHDDRRISRARAGARIADLASCQANSTALRAQSEPQGCPPQCRASGNARGSCRRRRRVRGGRSAFQSCEYQHGLVARR